MAVSEERITELFDQMLTNVDKDGWCHIPDGLTDEENDELSKRIAIMTMQDRIDTLMEGINAVFVFMNDIEDKLDDLETMDLINVKSNLDIIKEDAQTLLIDLHSDDKISDFFRIDIISSDDEVDIENMESAKKDMEELIDTKFKDSLDIIKGHCEAMIKRSTEIKEKIK